MGIDPLATGGLSQLHVSLHHAHGIARDGAAPGLAGVANGERLAVARNTLPVAGGSSTTAPQPHTPVRPSSAGGDANRWDEMLNRLGSKHNVPPLFLKAVMLIESGGDPGAVGDSGHSVGLFQLHDQGYGHGMGDLRFDPEANADRAAKGLAEAWQAGQRAGYSGEYAVRAAYDYSFNPGGGFAYQGDKLVSTYDQLLREQGLPGLS
jgi:soluble lytic murein transglycosylase-like protein